MTVEIKIVNKRYYKGPGFDIDRGTIMGNDATHINDRKTRALIVVPTRELAIEYYRDFFYNNMVPEGANNIYTQRIDEMIAHLKATGELVLKCWCAPEACHGEVIKEYIMNKLGMTEDKPENVDEKPQEELYIIAGTGSRSLQTESPERKLAVVEKIKITLGYEKAQHGDNLVVMSGMAEGFDKALALTALNMNIKLWCAIPTQSYGIYYWAQHSLTGQDRYDEFKAIVEKAWRVTYIMEDIHNTHNLYLNGRHANFVRNDWMMEQASYVLVWDPTSPGTKDAYATLKRLNKPHEVMRF